MIHLVDGLIVQCIVPLCDEFNKNVIVQGTVCNELKHGSKSIIQWKVWLDSPKMMELMAQAEYYEASLD